MNTEFFTHLGAALLAGNFVILFLDRGLFSSLNYILAPLQLFCNAGPVIQTDSPGTFGHRFIDEASSRLNVSHHVDTARHQVRHTGGVEARGKLTREHTLVLQDLQSVSFQELEEALRSETGQTAAVCNEFHRDLDALLARAAFLLVQFALAFGLHALGLEELGLAELVVLGDVVAELLVLVLLDHLYLGKLERLADEHFQDGLDLEVEVEKVRVSAVVQYG